MLHEAIEFARKHRQEFVTPEHVVMQFLQLPLIDKFVSEYFDERLQKLGFIKDFIIETQPAGAAGTEPHLSLQLLQSLTEAGERNEHHNNVVELPYLINQFMTLEESYASYYLFELFDANGYNVMMNVIAAISSYRDEGAITGSIDTETAELDMGDGKEDIFSSLEPAVEVSINQYIQDLLQNDNNLPTVRVPSDVDTSDILDGITLDDLEGNVHRDEEYINDLDISELQGEKESKFLTLITEEMARATPLIGREAEIDRTIQVLCRREKNNPLHIGEPGVGKTAIIYGLAARIYSGKVPDALKGSKIYELSITSLMSGTQMRGSFEQHFESAMAYLKQHGGNAPILYIDEMHNMMGAGKTSGDNIDIATLLLPHLTHGELRVIGATTHEDYNRFVAGNRAIARRFQQIAIEETTVEQTIDILKQNKHLFEDFHHVTYTDEAIDLAVKGSARYITDRYLPDKAIDLVDEAGAYLQAHPEAAQEADNGTRIVTKEIMAGVLARVARVDAIALDDDGDKALVEDLDKRMGRKIFGQDKAIADVVEAVQMARAGLTDASKPLASLLFVGPTGVGKTEVARVLASEMKMPLVRFDMSEYVEKHTVAKLIGAPAGYVGYEDGGLLTDAIKRTPECVLLLDEIEKAHETIFNILLQVMDYGVLTDNRGRKTNFANVVLIMTSNAGAQYAHQASVGFGSTVTSGQSMLKQVKKVFKPEFINRLSSIVVFNDMTREMASLVLDKKMGELGSLLASRKVTVELTDAARSFLIDEGFSAEYGAREMDRVLHQHVKTLLMREILFGKLKDGGHVTLDRDEGDDKLHII